MEVAHGYKVPTLLTPTRAPAVLKSKYRGPYMLLIIAATLRKSKIILVAKIVKFIANVQKT